MFCYIFRLSLKQSCSVVFGARATIVSRSGFSWIWSGARDQESTNHSTHFVEWKCSYITISIIIYFIFYYLDTIYLVYFKTSNCWCNLRYVFLSWEEQRLINWFDWMVYLVQTDMCKGFILRPFLIHLVFSDTVMKRIDFCVRWRLKTLRQSNKDSLLHMYTWEKPLGDKFSWNVKSIFNFMSSAPKQCRNIRQIVLNNSISALYS